jgi:hypothetical protein
VFNIDEYGSNFPKEVFDPKELGQDPNDFYDAICKKEILKKVHFKDVLKHDNTKKARRQIEVQTGIKKIPSLNTSNSQGNKCALHHIYIPV